MIVRGAGWRLRHRVEWAWCGAFHGHERRRVVDTIRWVYEKPRIGRRHYECGRCHMPMP